MIKVWPTRVRNVPLPEPFLFGIGAGLVLHRLWPRRLPGSDTLRRVLGCSMLGVGSALVASAWSVVGQVNLERPARLVSAGPYAISRNPMYVGWGLLHLGAALTVGSTWMAATPSTTGSTGLTAGTYFYKVTALDADGEETTGGTEAKAVLSAAGHVDLAHPVRLVSTGPYAISRNPMYVGWGLLHLGAALTVGSAWIAATFPPAGLWLHRQVLGEEHQLDAAFGDDFRRWQAIVPRYVGFRRTRATSSCLPHL